MSQLNVNTIKNRTGTSGPVLSGLSTVSGSLVVSSDATVSGAATVTGALTVGGVLTYEDVTNVDSVGIVTARTGLEVTANGLVINAGVSTFAADLSIADKIVHTGDTNTAIRFPAADTFTVETAGSERLRISSGGVLLVGATASVGEGGTPADLNSTEVGRGYINLARDDTAAADHILFGKNGSIAASVGTDTSNSIVFKTGTTEAARFDSSQRLLIGTASLIDSSTASNLQIANASGPRLCIARNNTTVTGGNLMGAIDFYGNDSNGTYELCGRMILEADGTHGDDDKPTRMAFYTTPSGSDTATERLRITNAGHVSIVGDNQKLLIGAGDDIEIYHDGSASYIHDNGTGDLNLCMESGSKLVIQSGTGGNHLAEFNHDGAAELFHNGTQKFATTSNGTSIGDSSSTYNEIANVNQAAKMHISGGGSGSGNIELFGASHSANSKEIHMTTNSVQRIKLNQVGGLTLRADTYGLAVRSIAAASASNTLFYGAYSSGGIELGTGSIEIYTNGNIKNTNNSYGSLSDQRLKENIVNATSQWNDIKSLQIRKFNFRENTGHQTHTQIGLIAQEVESVSPGLIQETPVREGDTVLDADGNQLESTKSINYSVLYMKAVKALQEAQTRIETLETKVAALEG